MDHPATYPTLTSLKADIKSFKELISKKKQHTTDPSACTQPEK